MASGRESAMMSNQWIKICLCTFHGAAAAAYFRKAQLQRNKTTKWRSVRKSSARFQIRCGATRSSWPMDMGFHNLAAAINTVSWASTFKCTSEQRMWVMCSAAQRRENMDWLPPRWAFEIVRCRSGVGKFANNLWSFVSWWARDAETQAGAVSIGKLRKMAVYFDYSNIQWIFSLERYDVQYRRTDARCDAEP